MTVKHQYRIYGAALSVLGRLHRISDRFDREEWVSSRSMADSEEVSRKTIFRTLDFLRDELGWEFNSAHSGYKLVSRGKPLIALPKEEVK